MSRAIVVSLFLFAVCFNCIAQQPIEGDKFFPQLLKLEGRWEGTAEWMGARTGKNAVTAEYSLTGFGSAVIETLIMGGKPAMTSVYHLDGKDLRVTHYCGARNQPRLIANRVDPATGQIDFKFVDITNLSSPDAGHVNGISLRQLTDKHQILTFQFLAGTKHSTETLDLWRKS